MASTSMASIPQLIEAVNDQLDQAIEQTDPDRRAGHKTIAISILLEIIQKQEERNQKIADALEQLAKEMGYPINSINTTRENIRRVARLVRSGEGQ